MTYKLWPLGSKVTFVCSVVLCNPPMEVEKFCLLWLDRYWFFQRTLKIWKLLCWEKKYPIQICNPKWKKKKKIERTFNMIEHWSILTCHVNVMSENIDEQNAIKFPLCSFAEKISLSCLSQSNFPRTNYHDLINLCQKR